MNETTKICPKCRTPIPPEAPQGLCPKCALSEAIEPAETSANRPAPPPLDQVKAAFPQLEVLELIGTGGMGAVFKVRQSKLDRLAALKVLPESLASTPGFADRFIREARLLARLNHPNVVGIYDFGQAENRFYLLMEFVDGVNLRQAMKAGRFSPSTALELVSQLCEAIQYAHNEGILHRDIKPENILLDTRGRMKIADFGIAKLLRSETDSPQLTASGSVLGTPHYMAPEQLERPGEVDQRADVYSLGVVFYEMLTGELPIGRFSPPSEKSSVDPRVDPIVLRALEKERERRFGSAAEVKSSVEHITSSPATAPPAPPRQEPSVHATPATARGATASFILTLLGFVPALLVALAGVFVFLPAETHGTLPRPAAALILIMMLVVLPMALGGLGLGIWALWQIYASEGRKRGLFRAMVGTLFWPLLLVTLLIARAVSVSIGGFLVGSPRFPAGLILTAGLPLFICGLTATLVWFLVTSRQASRSRLGWWLTPSVTVAVLFLPTLWIAFVAGNIFARERNFTGSSRGTWPGSAASDSSFSANHGGFARRGPVVARFAIAPGKGVIVELVINDRNGISAVPNSGAFLLASPNAEAAHTLLWLPKDPTADSSQGAVYLASWGVLNAEPATTNLQAEIRFPPALADRMRTFSADSDVGQIEDTEEERVMWLLERNGPLPGLGMRFRPFTHDLKADEIAQGGYAGFGTNWLESVRE